MWILFYDLILNAESGRFFKKVISINDHLFRISYAALDEFNPRGYYYFTECFKNIGECNKRWEELKKLLIKPNSDC